MRTSEHLVEVEVIGVVIVFEVVGIDDSSFTKSSKEMKQFNDVQNCNS